MVVPMNGGRCICRLLHPQPLPQILLRVLLLLLLLLLWKMNDDDDDALSGTGCCRVHGFVVTPPLPGCHTKKRPEMQPSKFHDHRDRSSSSRTIRSSFGKIRTHRHHFQKKATATAVEEEEEDWRQFRAKLVGRTSFEVGHIEQGSIVLSSSSVDAVDELEDDDDPIAFHDLNQPYFHKAVILITDHQPQVYTKGILLNRFTQLELFDSDIVFVQEEDENEEVENINNNNNTHSVDLPSATTENITYNNNNTPWKINFGGDIADVYDEETEITCLHAIRSPLAKNLSETILPDLYATSYLGARRLIQAGEATRDDFFVFHGFCGWDPGQLLMEMEQSSSFWITVSTDAKTIWNDLQELRSQPLQASGTSMWKSWRRRLGKNDDEDENTFSDLMLKEWTAAMLEIAREDILTNQSLTNETLTTTAIHKSKNNETSAIEPGMLLCASARNPSPFLLQEQYLHKSIVLVVKETEELSLGVILNLPSTNTFLLETPSGKLVEFPVRFGGTDGVINDVDDDSSNDDNEEEEDSLLWFHCSKGLKKLGIGSPVDDSKDGPGKIWVCDVEQVADAIDRGHALPSEFLVTQGFVCWEKQENGTGGIGAHILDQNFEVISPFQIENTWSLLQSQTRLNERTLESNFNSGMNAWKISRLERNGKRTFEKENEKDDDDDHLIYESNVKVSELADEALRHWISVYLVGGDSED